MRYSEFDADLDDCTAAELQLLVMELRGKIRELQDVRGVERLHALLHELFSLLPEIHVVCPYCHGDRKPVHQTQP